MSPVTISVSTPFRDCLRADGADYVVALVAVHLEDGQVESFGELVHALYLRDQLRGSFGALRLVVLEHLVPEGGGGAVEGDRPVVRLVLPQQLEQRAGEALDGVDHLPRLRDRQGRQRMKCTVHQRISVEEN